MKNARLSKRFLSAVMTVVMLVGLMVPMASAAETGAPSTSETLKLTEIDASSLKSQKTGETAETIEKEEHSAGEIVRVAIFLEKESTVDAGFALENIAGNAAAMAYRGELRSYQQSVTRKIESAIGAKLDVKWNITLAGDIISANVRYGDLDAIRKVPGVASAELETRYELNDKRDADKPEMASSTVQIGSPVAWESGYTGAGSKVAVIDTGVDKEHISFDGAALMYSLGKNAEEKGVSADEYIASLDLLTAEKVAELSSELNVEVDPAKAYVSEKIPYAYNYVDENYDVVHENDTQSEHGTHVSGIATANKYIAGDGGYVSALDTVAVQGVAPDAQLVTMKVFGSGGGAYDSDYMVAIEDAIILGCDSCNLSLGSSVQGFSFSDGYEDVLNGLVEKGMVVSISAGNSGHWYDSPLNDDLYGGLLYIDDNRNGTGGSPGTFHNALTVASVDNSGQTGKPLYFGDLSVFYSETSYGNEPISSIASLGELEYVMIDGVGTLEDFAALASVLPGKVAICSRGETSFYEKANAAVSNGAVATIIYNNTDGVINMNLTGYSYTAPAVSITQADGAAIKAQSERVELEDGTVYYTGTMTVAEGLEVNYGEKTDFQTASSFSSFGVPESLTMKPEIAAPGGSIYSTQGLYRDTNNQLTGGHDGYEVMSGTSMAAPQIAGMAALVAQYVRESGLCEKTGLTPRQLTNSLLMSTSHPIFDDYGDYWSVLKVGSGLANVGDAVSAKAYIIMDENSVMMPDSARDGKVKAELGDDPARTGEYTYTFTINPLGEPVDYTLRTDIFTQAPAGSDGINMFVDTATMLVPADVTYVVNGEPVEGYAPIDADVNGDGVTDAADAQAILDYLTGKLDDEATFVAEAADVDYDGAITSYDAHLILKSMTVDPITVSEPTTVTVTVKLADDTTAFLDYYYTGGAYVEGYTFIEPVSTEEGEIPDVNYSVPLLAYYGSWTDASMFDRSSVVDEAYGTGNRPYISANSNYMTVSYGEDDAFTYMGNPYFLEESFPADRLALSDDTTVKSFNYLPIRNIGTVGAAILDESGKPVWIGSVSGGRYAPFYNVNQAVWQNTNPVNYNVGKKISSLGFSEGDKFTVALFALPEYYSIIWNKAAGQTASSVNINADAFSEVIASGLLGNGAALSYTVTLDNTAPEVLSAARDLITGAITVKAKDNNYVAAVALLNKGGTKVYAGGAPAQDEAGGTAEITLDTEGVKLPDTVVILVADYAGNETAYEVELGGAKEDLGGRMFGFTSSTKAPGSGNRMLEIDADALWYNHSTGEFEGLEVYSEVDAKVLAAEYVDGYVFMACDDGFFHAAPIDALDETSYVGMYADEDDEITIYDMAFNYSDSRLYVLCSNNVISTMDLTTGKLEEYVTVSGIDGSLDRLAIDDENNFYLANNKSPGYAYLYSFNADDVAEGAVEAVRAENSLGVWNYSYSGSFAWDHDEDVLYLASAYNGDSDYDHYLWTVDTETGVAARANETMGTELNVNNPSARLYVAVNGLFIVPRSSSLIAPTDEADSITVEPEELNILRGQSSAALKAIVFPWTLTDKSVTWSSDNEDIATVNANGVVTGVSEGETVVTATSVAEPHVTFDVNVTVEEAPNASLKAILQDTEGMPRVVSFESSAPSEWTVLADAGETAAGALVGDTLYTVDDENMFGIDADTYEITNYGTIVSDWQYTDAAPVPDVLGESLGVSGRVLGLCYNGTYIDVIDPEAGSLSYWDMSESFGDDPLVTVAFAGLYEDGSDLYGDYFAMTESGMLYILEFDQEGELSAYELGETGIKLEGIASLSDNHASMIYDVENDFLYLALYDGNGEVATLYGIDPNDTARNAVLGDFGADVWPVACLYEYEPATDLVLKVQPESLTAYVGTESRIKVKVKLGETNEFTLESSDESVATVDETGLGSAVGVGEAQITVTTVDVNDLGEHLSATVDVTVKDFMKVNTTVGAQISDDSGDYFSYLDLSNLEATHFASAPGAITAGGLGGLTYLAAIGNTPVVLDMSTGEETTLSVLDKSTFSDYPAQDVANYPSFLDQDGEFVENKFLFTTTVGYLVSPDYYGWNLGSVIPGMAGLAFAGTDENDDGNPIYVYYIIDTDGVLYEADVIYAEGSISYSQVLDTGIAIAGQDDVSMTFAYDVDEEDNPVNVGLVIAVNSTKEVWYLDFLTGEVGLVGFFEGDNIDGLFGNLDFMDTVVDPEDMPEPDPFDEAEVVTGFYFETDPAEEGWTFVDSDEDGNNWIWSDGSTITGAYEGQGMIYSQSYINNVGPLTPDNWAVSPAIDLSEVEGDTVLSLFAKGQDSTDFAEHFAVYAGTTPNVDEMVQISAKEEVATGKFVRYLADLADFVGESEVYVAIRHFNVTDMYFLDVDQVEVLNGVPMPEPEPEPVDPFADAVALVTDDFETDPAEAGWTFVDADGDGFNWAWDNTGNVSAYDGVGKLYSQSYDNDVGPLTPDNWAVSPAIDLSDVEGYAYASVFAKGQDPDYAAEHFAIYAGTTPDVGGMTLLSDEFIATGEWTRYAADLSDFIGESEVYVAIRHFNVTDMFFLNVDNFQILISDEEIEIAKAPVQPAITARHIGDGIATLNTPVSEISFSAKPMIANEADGSLNAAASETKHQTADLTKIDIPFDVKASERYDRAILNSASGTAASGEVKIELSEDENVTNGVYVVEYDPEKLTFVGGEFANVLYSVNDEDGAVVVAFASDVEIEAETVIGTLLFNYAGEYVKTEVTVTTYERGGDVAVAEEPVVIEIEQEDNGHDWTEAERQEATCTEDGYVTYQCSKCGETKTEVLDATGHTLVIDPEVPATCTEDGLTAGVQCSVCDEILIPQEVITAAGHAEVVIPAVEAT
ncbi:MAG: S8 family serine peptidase, partial [Clostridia bacterium]|nr:S8 family serine peptidase [Clostridia bacterium]